MIYCIPTRPRVSSRTAPHDPSRVIDPDAFQWTDGAWCGVGLEGQALYEMHIGTFTQEGTREAAARELEELAAAGHGGRGHARSGFPGRFSWGYDGVDLFAPTRPYGALDDFAASSIRPIKQGLV